MESLPILVYIFGGVQLFYPAYLVYRNSEYRYAPVITFVLGIIIFFLLPNKLNICISIFLMGLLLFRIGKYFYSKIPENNKGKIIPEENRNHEKLYLESDLGTIEIHNPYRGILVSGSAGAGKSISFFYPIIRQLIQKSFSGILYDFKGELMEFAYSEFQKSSSKNIQFKLLDFKNPSKSNRVNPLSPRYVNKQAVALEMSTVLINNLLPESIKKKDFFTRSSISILGGAIWFLAKNYPNQSSLPHLITMICELPSSKLVEVICEDKECAIMLSSIKEALDQQASKQIASVVGTLKMAVSRLNIPEVFELMGEDDTSLDLNNPEQPTFFCIGNDSTLSETYAPVISLVISCCLRQLNQSNKHKSSVILDELPTIYIPGLEQLPATARSNKVSTILGFQDYSQLKDAYGNDKAQVLLSNCSNQFFGKTTNENTAKMLCSLAGKKDVTYKTESSGNNYGEYSSSRSKGQNESIQQRDRVTTSDLLKLLPGQFIGMVADSIILPVFEFVRFKQIENVSHESLPNITQFNSKNIENYSEEIIDLSEKKLQTPLLDININEEEIISENDSSNINLTEVDSSNLDDFRLDF